MQTAINQWLELISASVATNIWLGPVLALVAGILTSFTPCSLSTVPLIIGYVGGMSGKDTRKAFWLSVVFSIGMAVTFTVLGSLAALLGKLFLGTGSWWYIFLGVLMLLMTLQTWEIFNFIPSSHAISKNTRRGFTGAFFTGILGGFFSTPCATPVLIALLAVVAQEGDILRGILLLLVYSLGRSFLVLITGTSVGFVQRISSSEQYGSVSKVIRITLGAIIAMLAFYMFYLGL